MVSDTTNLADFFRAIAEEDDFQAWGHLCEAIREDLVRVASRLCRDPEQGEDIAQEALLAIREAAHRAWHRSSWTARDVLRYCKAIAAHHAISARRRSDRQSALDLESLAFMQADAGPEESVVMRELADLIREGLAEMREPFAEAVALHHLGGLSQQEVALQQGVSPATVRTRIWRGLRQLKAALRRRGVQASTLMVLVAMGELRAESGLVAPATSITTLCSKGAIIMATFSTGAICAMAALIAFIGSDARAAESGQAERPGSTMQQPQTAAADVEGASVTFEESTSRPASTPEETNSSSFVRKTIGTSKRFPFVKRYEKQDTTANGFPGARIPIYGIGYELHEWDYTQALEHNFLRTNDLDVISRLEGLTMISSRDWSEPVPLTEETMLKFGVSNEDWGRLNSSQIPWHISNSPDDVVLVQRFVQVGHQGASEAIWQPMHTIYFVFIPQEGEIQKIALEIIPGENDK